MEIEFVLAVPPHVEGAQFGRIEALAQAYAQGPVQAAPAPEEAAGYWFARFGVARQADWPVAPLRLSAEEAGAAYWLCADPIHLQLDHDRLLFDPYPRAGLTMEQAQALIAALNPQLRPEGMELRLVTPDQWVLRLPNALQVAVPAPAAAAGMPAMAALPQGTDARSVRRLSSEIQMLLHQAAGDAPVGAINSLWLWGGGTRPVAAVAPAPQGEWVLSSQQYVRELCSLTGRQSGALPGNWAQAQALLKPSHCHKALIDLTEIAWNPDWETLLQTNWLTPAALAARKQKLTFWANISTSKESLQVRLYRRDLFRFFHRKSLAQRIDKSQNR